jgi:hypothetical protein
MMNLIPNPNRKHCILYFTVKFPRPSLCGKEGIEKNKAFSYGTINSSPPPPPLKIHKILHNKNLNSAFVLLILHAQAAVL